LKREAAFIWMLNKMAIAESNFNVTSPTFGQLNLVQRRGPVFFTGVRLIRRQKPLSDTISHARQEPVFSRASSFG
jgi:hypothetical protein